MLLCHVTKQKQHCLRLYCVVIVQLFETFLCESGQCSLNLAYQQPRVFWSHAQVAELGSEAKKTESPQVTQVLAFLLATLALARDHRLEHDLS